MYLLRLDSKARSRSLQIKQSMAIASAVQQIHGSVDEVPLLLPLLLAFEEFLLGAEPVLFVLARFTTPAFI